jgi:hypothetical protein
VAPANETDMVLLPEGLKALKKMANEVGLDLRGAYLNLDGGFDSARNRNNWLRVFKRAMFALLCSVEVQSTRRVWYRQKNAR